MVSTHLVGWMAYYPGVWLHDYDASILSSHCTVCQILTHSCPFCCLLVSASQRIFPPNLVVSKFSDNTFCILIQVIYINYEGWSPKLIPLVHHWLQCANQRKGQLMPPAACSLPVNLLSTAICYLLQHKLVPLMWPCIKCFLKILAHSLVPHYPPYALIHQRAPMNWLHMVSLSQICVAFASLPWIFPNVVLL